MTKIHIPEPCHEDWGKMSTEAQGRFCTSCQKIVVDFTHMSDEDVKNYLLKNQQQKTCGRFLASQIDRPLENKTIVLNETWYSQLPYARQVFYAVALFFVLGVSACNWENNVLEKTEPQKTEVTLGLPSLPADFDTTKRDTVIFVPPSITRCEELRMDEELTGIVALEQAHDEATIIADSLIPKTIVGKIKIDTTKTPKKMPATMGFTAPQILEDTSEWK